MHRILYALILALLAVPAYAQQWDQVNGSMQVRSGPSSPLVIIDQTNTSSNNKILSLRANGTEKCSVDVDGDLVCAGSFSFVNLTFTGQAIGPLDTDCSAPAYSGFGKLTTGVAVRTAPSVVTCVGGSAITLTTATDFGVTGTTTITGALGVNGGLPSQDRLALKSSGNGFGFSLFPSTAGGGGAIAGVRQIDGATQGATIFVRASESGSNTVELAGLTGRVTATGGYAVAQVAISGTAPTIASGGCTSPTLTEANGTAAFTVTIGTTCAGVKTVTLTMPAADNLWVCRGENNTSDAAQQTNYIVARATSTTAVVLTSYDRVTGLQEDFTDSNVYLVACVGSGS